MVTKNDGIKKQILQIMKNSSFKSTDQLVTVINKRLNISEKDAIDILTDLESSDLVVFQPQKKLIPSNLREYLTTENASWIWIIAGISLLTVFSIVASPIHDIFVKIRYLFGSIFVLYAPGYVFIKALFPGKSLDNIERSTLSVATSLGLVPSIVLAINFSAFNITLISITFGLILFISLFSMIAVIREHRNLLNNI